MLVMRIRKYALLLVSLIGFSLLLALAVQWVARLTFVKGLEELKQQGDYKLELYVNYLQGVLGKFQQLPELLAQDEYLVQALLKPASPEIIANLNQRLEKLNDSSEALDTYLMDDRGLTIGASNWRQPHSFVGSNFSFRPYFQEALQGGLGRYFAIGTTSSKRGYYFAYPVRHRNTILGVVVVKIDIDEVEDKWSERNDIFLVSDPDGVIFISTDATLRYKTLHDLSPEVLRNIADKKRYPDTVSAPLAATRQAVAGDMELITFPEGVNTSAKTVLMQDQAMVEAGWQVHLLSDIQGVKTRVILVTVVVGLSGIVILIVGLLFVQRKQRMLELRQIEEKSKRDLRQANEQLESRVLERTQQLTETNELLRREILDRQQTEIKLKRARKELIHAAKLAVLGQMSAGINHELNQPLAAIRSYADNGSQFLEKGRLDDARWNLVQIGELTERMAQIGAQLKLFSRKSSGQVVPVPLHAVVDGAMEILKHSLKKNGVDTIVTIDPPQLEVRANHVLLQQVLVNLLSNAMQAMDGQEIKSIRLECRAMEDKVLVVVEDNGPGVAEEHLQQVFEPFFTTKKSGQGLGLGLTISDRIVRDFGGQIRLAAGTGGARFEFMLDRSV
jgi:two-component system, NtrC family, C4-dicarboxylate transport sensor histidine kinase DctB